MLVRPSRKKPRTLDLLILLLCASGCGLSLEMSVGSGEQLALLYRNIGGIAVSWCDRDPLHRWTRAPRSSCGTVRNYEFLTLRIRWRQSEVPGNVQCGGFSRNDAHIIIKLLSFFIFVSRFTVTLFRNWREFVFLLYSRQLISLLMIGLFNVKCIRVWSEERSKLSLQSIYWAYIPLVITKSMRSGTLSLFADQIDWSVEMILKFSALTTWNNSRLLGEINLPTTCFALKSPVKKCGISNTFIFF